MSIIHKLVSSLDRRNEELNQKLAAEVLKQGYRFNQ
jgi:hypothetical protein